MIGTVCTCGHAFIDEWEEVAHRVTSRHHYRSWTPRDGRKLAEGFTLARPTPAPRVDPDSIEGRFLQAVEGGLR